MDTKRHVPSVSIVIPYFQREPGILHGTVQAIIAHTAHTDYEIIVVDDGSPLPAREDLADMLKETDRLRIIEQANAGPGAARNNGLDNVSASTAYVALVDSDDRWVADLVDAGLAAMNAGYDLFFANSKRTGMDDTRFEWQAAAKLNLTPDGHELVDQAREVYAFNGDFFDYVVRRSSIISTSTMMYRFDKARELRFNTALFNGQDRLFKLHLAKAITRVAFSPKVYAHEGRGVNIFDSAGWGSPKSIRFLSSYIDLAKTILREVPLNRDQTRHVQSQLRTSRYNFTASLLHLLRHRQSVDKAMVIRTLRSDPATLLSLVPNMARAVLGKARGAIRS